MSSDLREQLLNAGLVSKEQFDGANSKPKRRAGVKPQGKAAAARNARGKAHTKSTNKPNGNSRSKTPPPLPPADGLSDKQRVMQLIQKLGKPAGGGEQEYYFPDAAGKVTKLLVTGNQKKALANGAMAVVYPQHRREQLVLVADYVAEEIAKLVATRIASWHSEQWPALKEAFEAKEKAAAAAADAEKAEGATAEAPSSAEAEAESAPAAS